MAIKNCIKKLIDMKGITRYQFMKQTGFAQNTAYRYYDDPASVPGPKQMNVLGRVYGWQPGDYLYFEPED